MHDHGPDFLNGPIRGSSAWWRGLAASESSADAESNLPLTKGIRKDLVLRIRREIAKGTYDTPERWEAALERLLDELER